ncbi:repair protein Rad1/Rec1/Rad17-domain-containing protein [Schizophyllum amplum]|uniref:Repair protein Rad1/Rec1/Rad17-domain-containing protein n=1 Tax=Schizophyllum amplum TaxID=97359 RepID=A0A550BYB3_9AGAR|nr:repair protein Rad1/Rec1/Rad17-domain-containing protein [Auriculariopsis ampla]
MDDSQPMSQSEDTPTITVLRASVHDVRFFAGMLRGVNFATRATISISGEGLKVIVEEARSLLGALTTLLECLNIFGSAGPGGAPNSTAHKKWRRAEDDDGAEDGEGGGGGGRRTGRGIEHFLGGTGDKRTGMRLSFSGEGYPLVLLLAEDASGPMTTCQISTYEADSHLELPFDSEHTCSSWLREALSELDPSIEKLTFISNPRPVEDDGRRRAPNNAAKPLFRIRAEGTFGSTECAQTVQFSYRFSYISRTLKAVQSSTKTSLRIDEDGLLSLQYLMPYTKPRGGEKHECYIEYRCLPLDDE